MPTPKAFLFEKMAASRLHFNMLGVGFCHLIHCVDGICTVLVEQFLLAANHSKRKCLERLIDMEGVMSTSFQSFSFLFFQFAQSVVKKFALTV